MITDDDKKVTDYAVFSKKQQEYITKVISDAKNMLLKSEYIFVSRYAESSRNNILNYLGFSKIYRSPFILKTDEADEKLRCYFENIIKDLIRKNEINPSRDIVYFETYF